MNSTGSRTLRHQALSETLAAMPRGGGNAIDFVSIGVFDQRPIV